MSKKPKKPFRILRFLTISLGICFGLYLALGFIVIPLIAKATAPNIVDKKIAGSMEIGAINLNPVTFSASLKNLNLKSNTGESIIRLKHVRGNIDPIGTLLSRKIQIAEVSMNGLQVDVRIDEDGEINLLQAVQMIEKAEIEEITTETEPSLEIETTFDLQELLEKFPFHIGRVELSHTGITFEDRKHSTPFRKQITELNVKMEGVESASDFINNVSMEIATQDGEAILVESKFQFNPLTLSGNVRIKDILLPSYSVYVEENADIKLQNGKLNVSLDFKAEPLVSPINASIDNGEITIDLLDFIINGQEDGHFQLQSLSLNTISINAEVTAKMTPLAELSTHLQLDGFQGNWVDGNETFIGFSSFNINELKFNLDPLSAQIDSITLKEPDLLVDRNEKGELSLLALLPKAPESNETPLLEKETIVQVDESSDTDSINETPVIDLLINKFQIEHALVRIRDASVQPTADFTATPIDLTVQSITLDPQKSTDVNLSVIFEDEGHIQFSSSIYLSDPSKQTTLKGSINNLPLYPFSPFSSSIIGFPISNGAFHGSLDCIIESNTLEATNAFKIQKIRFGEKASHFEGTSPPVKTAVAAMENGKGEIVLEIPLSGELDDPQFSITKIMSDVFSNLLKNAATAPFRLATQLTGSVLSTGLSTIGIDGGPDLSQVEFELGTDKINKESEAVLETIASVLEKRPQLILTIQGSIEPKTDALVYGETLLTKLLTKVQGDGQAEKIRTLYYEQFPEKKPFHRQPKVEQSDSSNIEKNVRKTKSDPSRGYYLNKDREVKTDLEKGSFYLGETKKRVALRPIVQAKKNRSPTTENEIPSAHKTEEEALPREEKEPSLKEMKEAIIKTMIGNRIDLEQLTEARTSLVKNLLIDKHSVDRQRIKTLPSISRTGASVIFNIESKL